MTTVTVTGANGYDVHLGSGVATSIGNYLGSATKALLIHQPVMASLAAQIRADLAGTVDVLLAEIPDGEDAKRVEVAAFCWGIMGQADFTRSDAVIGLGGGAATDLAGFVAATWLRGVRFVNIPTTVLGAVDASVGGKTGINTSEGKNLVGAFHAPAAVLVDTDILATLPDTEARAGFAEIAKAGFIADPIILDLIEGDLGAALDPTTDTGLEVLTRAIQVKATVVSEDFTEQGLREIEATVFKVFPGQPPMARADTLPLVLPVLGTGGMALARGSRVRLQLSEPDDITLDIQGQLLSLLETDASGSAAPGAEADDAALDEEENAGPLAIAVDLEPSDTSASPDAATQATLAS